MPRARILDPTIVSKIADKRGKKYDSVRGAVCKRARKLRISSEAALILLAREYGIGTAVYQRKLDPAKQAEVRDALSAKHESAGRKTKVLRQSRDRCAPARQIGRKAALKNAIEHLIKDGELRERCEDILLASKNFDRPINQATTVLEDRIRKKAQFDNKLFGENLVNHAFNEDLAKTKLKVEGGDADDQRGFTQILRGVVSAFRNKTHHHVTNDFSQVDAVSICGFIDVLLRVVDNSVKMQ